MQEFTLLNCVDYLYTTKYILLFLLFKVKKQDLDFGGNIDASEISFINMQNLETMKVQEVFDKILVAYDLCISHLTFNFCLSILTCLVLKPC